MIRIMLFLANSVRLIMTCLYKATLIFTWSIFAFIPMDAIVSTLSISNDYFEFPLSFRIPVPRDYVLVESDPMKLVQPSGFDELDLGPFGKKLAIEKLDCIIYWIRKSLREK